MEKTKTELNLLARSTIFALLWCSGVRILLPTLLDTLLSTLILGIIPPFLFTLITGGLLRKLASGSRWSPLVVSILFCLFALLAISPTPILMIGVMGGAGVLSLPLEKCRGFLRYIFVVLLATAFLPAFIGKKIEGTGLLVLGIDAMDFFIVKDLLREDQLPSIGKLVEEGAFGAFESDSPLFSPILWTTIASGRGRHVHGIDGFYNTSDHVRAPRIWDILEKEGWTVGLYRWLVTWPPNENVNGFWIPDILSRDGRAVPREYGIVNELRDLIKGQMISGEKGVSPGEIISNGWSILHLGIRGSTLLSLGATAITHPVSLFHDTSFRYTFMRRIEMEINCDLFLQLLKKYQPEFATFYDNSIDMVGHRYWKEKDPDPEIVPSKRTKDYSRMIPVIYGWTDRVVGRIVEELPSSCHIALVSDHGQQGMGGDDEDSWVILGDNVLEALDLDEKIYVATLGPFSFLFPVKRGENDLVPTTVSRELERLRMVEDDLPLLTIRMDPSSGIPFLDLTRRDFTGEENISVDGEVAPLSQFMTRYYTKTGTHDWYGVILLAGPGLRSGTTLWTANLKDLVPTLLHWERLPVARDMGGEVILQAFDSFRDIEYIESYMEDTIGEEAGEVDIDPGVKEELKALGYVN